MKRILTDGGKKISPDDLATKDELEAFKNDVLEALGRTSDGDGDGDEGDHGHEHDWPFDFDPDELDQAIEAKSKAMLDHIADPEACDDPECDHLRDKYGFTSEDEPDDPTDDGNENLPDYDDEEDEEDEDEPERGMFGARLE